MAGKGAKDKMKGKAKQAAGKITGDDRLKAEGRMEEAKGKAKDTVDEAGENIRGTKESLKRRTERS
ncbi:CsbD family protein [Streptomyces sp. NPDC021749]|uniref:CsbD family protein n=1 Tax=Streptomyces sp. NPDC021749 TaxID=3154905 RepID=UPI0033E4AA81